MRNLKKILALALALVMTLSLMTVANAFNDDKDIDATYNEAVQVLTGLKVFKGVNDGSNFAPKQTITRGEVAAIIYRIVTGDVNDTGIARYAAYAETSFDDVKATDWYAGYIGYCANAELIVGDGTNFYPAQTVNGYQALAMILRAVGYDANDEFKGNGWEIRVASTAQQLTLLKNIGATSLSGNASREMVAELLFRALVYAPMVQYTTAFGYQPVVSLTNVDIYDGTVKVDLNGQTLGMATFGLKQSRLMELDVWGRPGYVWYTNKTSNTVTASNTVATMAQKPVYTTTVKVDECDIAEAIGLTRNTPLEKAYIDGESISTTSADVTSNRYASINPLATTSYVGAQGRLTEVYDMGGSLRLVEINTYLAQVDKVTPIYTDKNGHVVDATVDLQVFYANAGKANTVSAYDMNGIRATGYAVGDYVLVQVSNPNSAVNRNVEVIKAANLATGGNLAGWTNAVATTPATTVIGTTTYNDADKFVYNWRQTGNWMVATDDYGNVIGLVPATVNYLVVEQIEWRQNTGAMGGYALANVVLADGSKVSNVTVSSINGIPANNLNDQAGVLANGSVSDSLVNNTAYYEHIFTYSVNSNGTYNIAKSAHNVAGTTPYDVTGTGIITNGSATISGGTNTYVATDNTVFLLENADGYTYTTYVGKNAVPSLTGADLCILTNSSGYATLVVVNNYDLAANTFLAYVTDNQQDTWGNPLGDGYYVYKLGETTGTLLFDDIDSTKDWNYAADGTGLYMFTVNANNQIQSMTIYACDLHCGQSAVGVGGINLDRLAIKAGVSGNSFQAYSYADGIVADNSDNGYHAVTIGTTALKDFNVTANTQYIVVTKNAYNGATATLRTGTASDLTAGSVVLVDYTAVVSNSTTIYTADTVYVLRIAGDGTNPNPNPTDATIGAAYNGTTLSATLTEGNTVAINGANLYYQIRLNNGSWSTATQMSYVSGSHGTDANGNETWGYSAPVSIVGSGTYEIYVYAVNGDGTTIAYNTVTIVR